MKMIYRLLAWIASWFRKNAPAKPPLVHCGFSGCEEQATSHIRWGASDKQHSNVCDFHRNHVWLACQCQIADGICFWIQEPAKA